ISDQGGDKAGASGDAGIGADSGEGTLNADRAGGNESGVNPWFVGGAIGAGALALAAAALAIALAKRRRRES
ncbi:MAG: hypothetical protein ACTMIK_06960, partial [Galactobacter sp.]